VAITEVEEFRRAFWSATPAAQAPWRLKVARACARAGNKQGVFDACGYAPVHAAQAAFHQSTARNRVVLFGRRCGKTLAAMMELVFLLLQDDKKAWVVAPQHDTTKRIWRRLDRLFTGTQRDAETGIYGLGIVPISISRTPPFSMVLPWGSLVEAKSTQPGSQDSLVGESLDAIVWDECARSPGSVWDQELAPCLLDRGGWAVFPSTPQGFNHFYDRWCYCQPGHEKWQSGWESFFAPSWENPRLDPEKIEEERRRMTPETFDQEYGAKFTQLAGRVFAEWDERVHVRPLAFDPLLSLCLTFDFGTTDASPFACLWLQETPENVLGVLHELVIPNRSTYECAGLLAAEHHKLGDRWPQWPDRAAWATGDPAGSDARMLLKQVCPIIPSRGIDYLPREIEWGIERIRLRLRPQGERGPVRLLVDPSCATTKLEFNLYRRREHREGTNIRPEPIDENNHCLAALRYYEATPPIRRVRRR